MRSIFLLLILLLFLPLISAEITISCKDSFNPFKESLAITVESDTSMQGVELRVVGTDESFSQALILKDSRGRAVSSLSANKPYFAEWSGLDSGNVPVMEQRYFFKIVGSHEVIPGVGFSTLDLNLDKTEYTRSELAANLPAKTWKFTLFKDKHSADRNFVLVLDESDPLFESQDIDLTAFEVEGIDPSFLSVNWNKSYKFYPNKAELVKRRRLSGLTNLDAKLSALKQRKGEIADASISVHSALFKRFDSFNNANLGVIRTLESLSNFEREETFLARSSTVFLEGLSDDEKIALRHLANNLKVVYLGEPYVVNVRVSLPEEEFAKAPFTLSGKIKFKYRQTKETVRDFEIQVINSNAEEKIKQLCPSCPDAVVREAINQSLTIGEIKELEISLKSIKTAAGKGAYPEAAKEFVGEAFKALENEKVAALFVRNPKEFVEIAEGVGFSTGDAFKALENEKVAALFRQNPVLVRDAFIEVTENVGRTLVGNVFNDLEDDKIASVFVEHPNDFFEITEAVGNNASCALDALKNPRIASLFAKNPVLVKNTFIEISKFVGSYSPGCFAFQILGNEKVAALFVRNPQEFVEIAKRIKTITSEAFRALENDGIADLFRENPVLVRNTFVEVLRASDFYFGLLALENDDIAALFVKYAEREISFDELMINIYASEGYAVEVGRPLDDLHDNSRERRNYLGNLNSLRVFAFLLTNPEFFYTTTNHLLFDRLESDLGRGINLGDGKITTVTGLFEKLNVSDDLRRNFIFRAINYDRFYGKPNSLFKSSELDLVVKALFDPISSEKFDEEYYFLLANTIQKFSEGNNLLKETLTEKLTTRLLSAKKSGTSIKVVRALEYCLFNVNEATPHVSEPNKGKIRALKKKSFFYPKQYLVDGKLQVLQVFDKEDTKKDHWGITKGWFKSKLGEPTQGADGESIYENSHARVILFMGEDEETNKEFISNELKKHPSQIVTFRGHSYSLAGSRRWNFPFDIFGNRPGNILFIPGSCGSAGSTRNILPQIPIPTLFL